MMKSLMPAGFSFRTVSRQVAAIVAVLVLMAVPVLAQQGKGGMDQAKPGETVDPHAGVMTVRNSSGMLSMGGQDRTAFEQGVQLDEFRRIAVQHLDHIKIIDSWARQSVRKISYRVPGGKDAVYVALDMALRPEAWMNVNIIYVESVPVRDALAELAIGSTKQERDQEKQRIHEKGLVSPMFLDQPQVRERLQQIALDSRQVEAVNKVFVAWETFVKLYDTLKLLPPAASMRDTPWLHPSDVVAAGLAEKGPAVGPVAGIAPPTVPAGVVKTAYTAAQDAAIQKAFGDLVGGWRGNNVTLANQGLREFAAVAPTIDPEIYPSPVRRSAELWYNRTFSGMLVAIVYFAALVLFFMAAIGITKKTRKAALWFFGVALACHLGAMGVRWWINGRIPIQNQFESIMGAAAIGCVVGLCLELWKKNGIFGAAFGFVGWLATTTLLAAPYVFGNDLGAAPGVVAGILSNIWLYIHVNIVIASYSLICASAAIALIYLGLRQWHWINPLEPGFDDPPTQGGPGGGKGRGGAKAEVIAASAASIEQITAQRAGVLETLDQANMVVLQMAFWTLGVGIMCGAVWADHSWGRPWGWDPKETFALVTWIVYLVIVHMRLVIKQKADSTAILSLVGCGVMLFNYIGVNYFLKGLHSYA